MSMSREETRSVPVDQAGQREVFAEVSLFDAQVTGSEETGDCGCFNCDGNPCVK